MCVTDRHDMTLAVKVALNPNTTNQPRNTYIELSFIKKIITMLDRFDYSHYGKGVLFLQFFLGQKSSSEPNYFVFCTAFNLFPSETLLFGKEFIAMKVMCTSRGRLSQNLVFAGVPYRICYDSCFQKNKYESFKI